MAALLAPACAIALGVQDDPTVASATICGCDEFRKTLPATCATDIEARLSGALPADRTAWLQYFATECMSSCPKMAKCFYRAPACVASENPCSVPAECCSFNLLTNPFACDKKLGTCK